MRIAVVIESFNPAAGGNERSTRQIVEELVGRGHHVTLLTGHCPPGVSIDGADLRAMSPDKSSSARRLRRFARWARHQLDDGGFDVSLSMTMAVAATVLQPRGGTIRETQRQNAALRRSAWARAKKRLEFRLDPKQRRLLALEAQTLADPRVRRVAALSQYVVRQLEEHYRFPASRTAVIPNAAVMPGGSARQLAELRGPTRRRLQIPEASVAYLFAAQNPRLKGWPTLADALARLQRERVPAVAILAGGFTAREQHDLDRRGLAPLCRVVGQADDMAPLYAAADVTVLPTWYDPSSKVVLESLMTATPAISTTFNGASDHLAPPDGPPRGIVLPDPGDDEALAAAMQRLADPAIRQACAEACVGLDRQLSMTCHVDALEQLLLECAKQTSRAG